ncbi:hypothetical protein B0F90DRAFT_1858856 [Multifurca ochricompacta]|uniref:Transmembrane protein n=1 Tax=Multifurca ochricompacta TaxID=376703 RepID=A0AAD4QK12_9AGAM|nr:hypothetical protein B0F90DRAFT_1858856 [Multifurca ochricompacta]
MCRSTIFAVFFLLAMSFYDHPQFVQARQVNVTVDDTDPLIVYQPATSWFFNGNTSGCAVCLTPPSPAIAYKRTWHHGLHVIPTVDMDDLKEVGGRKKRNSASSTKKRDNDLRKERRGTHNSTHDPTNDATASPFVTNKFDVDDAGFVDLPVSVQFNFTGSAVYLYCVLPLGVPPNTNSTPTLMNLTFTLDDETAGTFLHDGSANTGGFQSNFLVFSQGGLLDSAHSLRVHLGPNSVFLLDYYVFSRTDGLSPGSSAALTTAIAPAPTRASITEWVVTDSKKHDTATFAGAVGGSVGVLAIISACLAFSIYRRRRLSAQRQLGDREHQFDAQSFHTHTSEDSPSMHGPAPFIPRYFPGTIPAAPPPYFGSVEGSSVPTTLNTSSEVSYHFIPPPVPSAHHASPEAALSAMHGAELLDVPPPFSVAISSSEPPVLSNAMRRTLPRIPPPIFIDDAELVPPGIPNLPAAATAAPPLPLPLRS